MRPPCWHRCNGSRFRDCIWRRRAGAHSCSVARHVGWPRTTPGWLPRPSRSMRTSWEPTESRLSVWGFDTCAIGSVRHICARQVGLTKEIHRSLRPPRHLELTAVFARRESTYFPECQREVSLTRESATVCDFCNAHIRFAEQSSCAIDPPIQHIAMRRHAGGRVKRPEEMAAAVANFRRECLKREIRIETTLNELLNARQFSSREGHRPACLPLRSLTQKQEAYREGLGERVDV